LKKIFIVTGETSGDKIASIIVSKLQEYNKNIIFKAVGGSNLKKQNVDCIFDIGEIAFMGIVDVVKNFLFIKRKFDLTVKEILKFNPDIILSVDSPDFSFRILKKIKNINPKIKTFHVVAPQVWAWRENRKKTLNQFIDHLFLLFPFEKKYFDGFINNTFVGHPFFFKKLNFSNDNNNLNYISICPGSRLTEIKTLMPLFISLVQKLKVKFNYKFHIPAASEKTKLIENFLLSNQINDFKITTHEDEKNYYFRRSVLSIAKSGTIALDIMKNLSPLIVIYKTSWLNYFLIKPFVKVKFGNIINIIKDEMIVPELIQSDCNLDKLYNLTLNFLENDKLRLDHIKSYIEVINQNLILNDGLDKLIQKLEI